MQVRRLRNILKLDENYSMYATSSTASCKPTIVIQHNEMLYAKDGMTPVGVGKIEFREDDIIATYGWKNKIRKLKKPLLEISGNKKLLHEIFTKDDVLSNPITIYTLENGEIRESTTDEYRNEAKWNIDITGHLIFNVFTTRKDALEYAVNNLKQMVQVSSCYLKIYNELIKKERKKFDKFIKLQNKYAKELKGLQHANKKTKKSA